MADSFLDLAAEIAVAPFAKYSERRLYAHRGAGLAVVLTWDRAGLHHAETVFDYRTVGRTREASDGWEHKVRIVDWSTFDGEDAA